MAANPQERQGSRLCRGTARNPFRSSQFDSQEDTAGTVRKTALRNQGQQLPQDQRPELRHAVSFEELTEDTDGSGTEIWEPEAHMWMNIRSPTAGQAQPRQTLLSQRARQTNVDIEPMRFEQDETPSPPRAGSRWAPSQRTVIKRLTLRRDDQQVKSISFGFDDGGAYVNEASSRSTVLIGDRLLKIHDVDVIGLPDDHIRAIWRDGAKTKGFIDLLLAGPAS
mmetsp:Transcript_24296/g.44604  ORF Transcript_24296/g.44604 Transcript_24296/m.44604 type:complete len:223 (-) Transcript_24296:51-719(-)